MSIKPLALALGAILGALALPGCNLDIPDLNNPGLEPLENNPTAAGINTAATGLLIGNRGGKSAPVGFVNLLGILGRESYDFDSADARFNAEMIQANLSKASPFGGSFWAGPYANIRLANIILHGVDKVPEFTPEDRSAIQGFAHTIIALELLTVIVTHAETGAVIDTDLPLGDLGPFVKKDAVYAEIARLLDLSQTELATAGDTAFTFPLSPGYKGFDTPAKFIKFNRAIRARVAVYQKDYTAALDALKASFLNDAPATLDDLKVGVYYVYTTNGGDATNGLINKAIYAHPKLQTEAQMQADGTTIDARYTAKIVDSSKTPGAYGADPSLKSQIKFQIYPSNTSNLTLIRNEELILLKAEALYYTKDPDNALAALNVVRTLSGKLPALTLADITDEVDKTDKKFVDALLYERRYSLMFEGGHRWIDFRRFNRLLPLDADTHTRNIRFPVPQAECDARPGEPACTITSSDILP